jgi:hypothetical protein
MVCRQGPQRLVCPLLVSATFPLLLSWHVVEAAQIQKGAQSGPAIINRKQQRLASLLPSQK